MNYLVDTHILLWSFLEPDKLSKNVKNTLLHGENKIYYSPVSLWEISIKYGNEKLFLNGGTPDDFFNELNDSYFICKSIEPLHLITNYKLPIYHKDPFDRILIWEAISSDLILISTDENFEIYTKEGLKLLQNI